MFRQLLIPTMATIALLQVGAVDVCAFSDTLGCPNRSSLCCKDIGPNNCCGPVPEGFGFSVAYLDLPEPVSDGQAWQSNNCGAGAIITQQIGTWGKCWVSAGTTKAGSKAWTHAASKGGGSTVHVSPNVLKYTDDSGAKKTVKIPSGELEKIAELVKVKNFKALASA
ncbi:hypothetical protein DFH09DRAFT_1339516 [Mycena vulgaris]|nr:hypothetical protein DFH09DRAFT_1339516 [Mycena vulgaris]